MSTRCREYSEESMREAMREYPGEPLVISDGIIYRDQSFHHLPLEDTIITFKNLVLCLDGTGNTFNAQPFTNVLKLFRMLDKDSIKQLCYYQPGIGVNFYESSNSITDGDFFTSTFGALLSRWDTFFAYTLKKHVIAAYNFLCRFYNRGDKIYFFGFSRGSFTARIVAGMIERVGLLNQGLEDMSGIAWDLYCNWENAGQPMQNEDIGATVSLVDDFKVTFSRSDTEIYFMGLWDTVNSVGLIIDRMFPYTIRSSIVRHVRHAVSIDERRSKFKQLLFEHGYQYLSLFDGDEPGPCAISNTPATASSNPRSASASVTSRIVSGLVKRKRAARLHSVPPDDLKEVYFPGNHGDCGGGWARDHEDQNLSNVPLRWILLEAIKFSVLFKSGALHSFDRRHSIRASFLSCDHDLLSLSLGASKRHPGKGWSALVRRNGGGNLHQQQRAQELEIFQRATPRIVPLNQGPAPRLPTEPVERFDSRGNEFWGKSISWWFIELLPFGYKVENRYGEWKRVYAPNIGRPRRIARDSILHWSVFYRLHYCSDYNPANLDNHDFGKKFLALLKGFEELFTGFDLAEFCDGLTIEKIRSDWSVAHPIWRIIPDELGKMLEANPSL